MNLHKRKISISPLQSAIKNTPRVVAFIDNLLLYLSGLGLLVFLYDIGFDYSYVEQRVLHYFYHWFFLTVLCGVSVRILVLVKDGVRRPSVIFEGLLLGFMIVELISRFLLRNEFTTSSTLLRFFDSEQPIYFIIIYVFFIEVSKKTLLFYRSTLHPAHLFVLSFVFLIAVGTFLLSMPQATVAGISFIDALFTATSAVCVTGLITVDTATVFTPAGKVIILILIQVGGLGIMTFASFFGIFFQGSSLKSSLFMKDWINEENLGQITQSLFRIVSYTFGLELLGALLLYWGILDIPNEALPDKFSFALFHSVSAFCNAGFSTLSLGLYDPMVRYNYHVQMVLALLIIMGGLGFPILFNLYRYMRYKFLIWVDRIVTSKKSKHTPRLLNVNTLLVLITTGILLAVGMVLYFILEYNNTLAEHSLKGKIIGAFFGSVTPRTAGFNTVDMAALTAPTILIYYLLMWIGASPASVGGGIKTTTIAVAALNVFNLGRGKDRVEVFKRELGKDSVYKAFAIIVISLLVIGMGVFLITIFNPELELSAVIFECVSGFSTVGLSVGITGLMSTPSKVILIFTMFLGRVGILTLIMGLFRKVSTLRYRYPKETIIIT